MIRVLLAGEGYSVSVFGNDADVDNSPDGSDESQEPAGEHGDEKLGNSLAGVAGIEVVDAETTEECYRESQQKSAPGERVRLWW